MKDKIVWITGASSGIGAACAEVFSSQGAKVILSARSEDKMSNVQKRLTSESKILPLDVTNITSLPSKCEEAISLFGHVDVLINNAGMSQRSFAEETDLSVDRKIFELNYFGNIALTKSILPHMLNRQSGNLVIISSVAGKLSSPGRSSYAASKHALHGFYDALRAETSDRGIHVNMICPGYIQTDISLHALNAKGEKHGTMDPGQAKGMSAIRCAEKIVQAVISNKPEVFIGGRETQFVKIRKFFPKVYYRMIAKMAREKRY